MRRVNCDVKVYGVSSHVIQQQQLSPTCKRLLGSWVMRLLSLLNIHLSFHGLLILNQIQSALIKPGG